MEIYTNCSTCSFFDKKNKECGQGLWESKGFKGLPELNQSAGGHILPGVVCPYHRYGKNATFENAQSEAHLGYGLVLPVPDTDLQVLTDLVKSFVKLEPKIRPKQFYFIDDRSNKSNPQTVFDELTKILSEAQIEFKYKNTVGESRGASFYVDQYASTGKIKQPFYIYFDKIEVDKEFLNGLWSAIYEDMIQLMYGGKDGCYWMPTGIHKLCKGGFKEFLEKENLHDNIMSYEEICQTSCC